jgi:cephalosporin hydroxylase
MQYIRKVTRPAQQLTLSDKYIVRAQTPSDINEHLPTLLSYGMDCNHITECGVRSVVSSYAFAVALKNKSPNKLIQVDLDWHPNLDVFKNECMREGVNVVFYKQSDLECPMEETELLFIDTWHIYGHLKRELERWNPYVSKYIIFHDTTVDEWYGESIRMGMNIEQQVRESGYPEEEIRKGLWPAIEEFLEEHPEWEIKERFTNNNGLTILKRV